MTKCVFHLLEVNGLTLERKHDSNNRLRDRSRNHTTKQLLPCVAPDGASIVVVVVTLNKEATFTGVHFRCDKERLTIARRPGSRGSMARCLPHGEREEHRALRNEE